MSSPQIQIQIRLPTPSEQNNPAFIQSVTTLINEAYGETESKLYKPGQKRTNAAEVRKWLASGHFYLAFSPSATYPIGSVNVPKIEPGVSDLGVLTVHRDARSMGLGRRLIAHAEGVAIADGSGIMRLELLFPKPPQTHEFKSYLKRFYAGLGYEVVGRASIAEIVPQIAESFEEGSEFLVMEKGLVRN